MMAARRQLVRKLDLVAVSRVAPPPKSPRGGGSASQQVPGIGSASTSPAAPGAPVTKQETKETMVHLQKLSLLSILNTRELAGSLYITVMVPIGTAWAKPPAAAGKAYSAAVKDHSCHDLGPPWPHTAFALLQGFVE